MRMYCFTKSTAIYGSLMLKTDLTECDYQRITGPHIQGSRNGCIRLQGDADGADIITLSRPVLVLFLAVFSSIFFMTINLEKIPSSSK